MNHCGHCLSNSYYNALPRPVYGSTATKNKLTLEFMEASRQDISCDPQLVPGFGCGVADTSQLFNTSGLRNYRAACRQP